MFHTGPNISLIYISLAVDSAVGEQMKKAFLGGEMKELVDPYLLLAFAGKEVSVVHFYVSHGT